MRTFLLSTTNTIHALEILYKNHPEAAPHEIWAKLFVECGKKAFEEAKTRVKMWGDHHWTAAKSFLVTYLQIPPEYRPMTAEQFLDAIKGWPPAAIPRLDEDPHLLKFHCSGLYASLAGS